MTVGRQTIPATTATALEITGHYQIYLKSITNNIDIINDIDTDASNGYSLVADTDYIINMQDLLYLYAASETVVQYMVI